ncbi:SDR family NAD(P)-dependent oxidoreductase [Francisella noatunensis]
MSVKNKVTLITGAASGLGLGMATEFAKQGAKVVIADLRSRKITISNKRISRYICCRNIGSANGCYK